MLCLKDEDNIRHWEISCVAFEPRLDPQSSTSWVSCLPTALCSVWNRLGAYLRERHDKVMQLSLLRGSYDSFHGDVSGVVPILDVLQDATVEQHWLLGHHSNVGTEELDVHFFAVMTVYHLQKEMTTKVRKF